MTHFKLYNFHLVSLGAGHVEFVCVIYILFLLTNIKLFLKEKCGDLLYPNSDIFAAWQSSEYLIWKFFLLTHVACFYFFSSTVYCLLPVLHFYQPQKPHTPAQKKHIKESDIVEHVLHSSSSHTREPQCAPMKRIWLIEKNKNVTA